MMSNNLFKTSDRDSEHNVTHGSSRNAFNALLSPKNSTRATNLLEQSILSPDKRHQWIGSFGKIEEQSDQLELKVTYSEEDFGILDQEIARFANELMEKEPVVDVV